MYLDSFEPLFYRKYHPDFFFVQIGANDGLRADALHELITRHHLAGIAVEPLPDFFKELTQTYAQHPQVKLVNAAIHRHDRRVTLFRVPRDQPNVPDQVHGTASLNPKHHELLGIPADIIVKEAVPAMSLAELFETCGVKRIDLLQIDTEGYDAEIVRMLFETVWRPELIRFEHGISEGTMSVDEFWALGRLLMDNGYSVVTEDADAIAYKRVTSRTTRVDDHE